MNKFKIGDLVYCPVISCEILTITSIPEDVMLLSTANSIDKSDCGFVLYLGRGQVFLLKNGHCMKANCQKVVHATQENYELLSKLYPTMEFEPPPKTPVKIINAMLQDGWRFVVVEERKLYRIIDNDNCNSLVDDWRYTRPIDPKTGKVIIDYVNSEIVLGDEYERNPKL